MTIISREGKEGREPSPVVPSAAATGAGDHRARMPLGDRAAVALERAGYTRLVSSQSSRRNHRVRTLLSAATEVPRPA